MNSSMHTKITGTTKLFGCIAFPSDHVRAPMIFNDYFLQTGTDAVMVPVSIPPQELSAAIAGLRRFANFCGAAVTIPHKMPLASLCDELGAGAQAAQAVNAIKIGADGRLYGNNFDGEGFVAGLLGENPASRPAERIIAGSRILLVGAGGAARAIALSLASHQAGHIDILNRTPEHALQAAALTAKLVPSASVAAVAAGDVDFSSYDTVINATSLGLHDDDPLPFAPDSLGADCLVCDIIMIPARTRLLAAAEATGRPVHYGRHMLDYQIELIGKFIGAFDQPKGG